MVFASLLAVGALAGVPLSVPVTRRMHNATQTLHGLRQRRRELSDTMAVAAPSANTTAAAIAEALHNNNDVSYTGTVSLGTPAQSFDLIMDTGSSNLWVSTTGCSDAGCSTMHKYNPSASSTYKKGSESFNLAYGTGSCSGTMATETLSVGVSQAAGVQFGGATTTAAFFQGKGMDGIFGLGLKAMAAPQQDHATPPIDALAAAGAIPKRMIGVSVTSDSSASMQFGGYDSSKFTGKLTWNKYQPFQGQVTYYLVAWDGMKVGSTSVSCGQYCLALVDSGTSYMVGPTATVNQLLQSVQVSEDCTGADSAPTIDVTIGGQTYSIPPSVYILRQNGQCEIAIQGGAELMGANFWIFGDTFMRATYNVFDNENMQLGIAPASHI